MKCIRTDSLLYEAMEHLNFNRDEIADITNKLNQEEFNNWYGKGVRDSFNTPKPIGLLYLENDKRERVTLNNLLNDEFYNKREHYSKDLTDFDKINKLLSDLKVSIGKRISAFRDTDYSKRLERLLEELNALEEVDFLQALQKHSEYIFDTVNNFELKLYNYDKVNKNKLNTIEKNKLEDNHKNFLVQASDFLYTFSKIKQLNLPVNEVAIEREIVENLKKIENRVTDLKNKIDTEIEAYTRDLLDKYISDPDVRNGIIDFLAAQVDESGTQRLLDALGDSHIKFLAGVDKFFKKTMYEKDEEVKDLERDWEKFLEQFGKDKEGEKNFNEYLKSKLLNPDGSGRLIQKYRDEYNEKSFELRDLVNTLKDEGKEGTKEFSNALENYFTWKKDNTEQKYVKEYYEALNKLTPLARKAKEDIDIKKSDILAKGLKILKPEDFEELRALEVEMNNLKSKVYIGGDKNGQEKTGEDLEIANSLFKYSQEMSKFYETINTDEKGFNKSKKDAEEKGEEYLQKWLSDNTTRTFSDNFWNFFKQLKSKMPSTKALEDIEENIKHLTVGYKNKYGEIKGEEMPKELLAKVIALQGKKSMIKHAINQKLSKQDRVEVQEAFRKFIVFEATGEYHRTFGKKNEQLANKEITEEEYNNWFHRNHDTNEYTGEITPISIWTKMRPRDIRMIVDKPNKLWNISGIKSEFLNPKHELDFNGFPIPTDNWISDHYKKLDEKDIENLDIIQKKLLYLTAHTKGDIIKKGYLPAIPKDRGKGEAKEFTNVAITEADKIVKFIPFKYVKRLNQVTQKPVPNGAIKEEIEKIKKENESIRERNKKEHGDSIDLDLANTMKTFIKTALTNKYKKRIEIDIKILEEQLKRQKVHVTNPRGTKMYDKIKSTTLGTKEKYEVSAIGSNMEKHFNDWLEGVFYDDFEKDEGWISNWASKIQDFTSLRALGFNILSGLNNKLIGNIQGRIEAAGGQYYNYSDYRDARKRYSLSMTHFINNHNKTTSNNINDALIKKFDVLISQDELNNKPNGKIQTLIHKASLLKNAAYFMMHIGEHQIQNGTLLAMLNSHRIIDGKVMTFNEYLEGKKAKISFDKKMSEQELNEEFAKLNTNYEISKGIREEFEGFTKLINAYEIKEGVATLKSNLKLNEDEIFNFRERVIGLNHRLHGIYNTEDAAMIQRGALGRLGMQFRKWMRPGWNRRFGSKFGESYYNERVRFQEEGMYVTTFKYLFGPAISNYKEFKTLEEKTATKAFKMILDDIKDIFTNARIRWHIMSETEKSNVRKTGVEFTFLIAVICLGYMVKKMKGEDDDDEDRKFLTLALYQCDRLFGELTTYTPLGVVREANRLFSSPSPVFNTFEDLFKLGTAMIAYPFRDEETREFKSGIYHGRDKLGTYLRDMIPVYNQLQRIETMNESNNRYGLLRNHGIIMEMLK